MSGGIELIWAHVDTFFAGKLLRDVSVLSTLTGEAGRRGIPDYHVSPSQGAFLQLILRTTIAKRVKKTGTLAGFSLLGVSRRGNDLNSRTRLPSREGCSLKFLGYRC